MKFSILAMLILPLFIFTEVNANNIHIPNYYKNRRTANKLGAIGWSDRREAGAELIMESGEENPDDPGLLTADTDELGLASNVFVKINEAFNVEFAGLLSDAETEYSSTSSEELKGVLVAPSFGYKIQGAPIAMGVGLNYFKVDRDSKSTFGTSSAKQIVTGIRSGMSFKLPNNMFLGFGLGHDEIKVEFGSFDDKFKRTTVDLGLGHVIGGLESPIAAYEFNIEQSFISSDKFVNLSLTGLYNVGITQIYGGLEFQRLTSSGGGGKEFKLTSGVDVSIKDFYVGPELAIGTDKGGEDTEASEVSLSVQGGYRNDNMEFFLRLEAHKEDIDEKGSFATDYEETSNVIALGGIFKF